jgi:ferrochelatase
MSFHGIPREYFLKGDPYHCECHKTARLLAESLGLRTDQWQLTFQSRLGPKEWLKPYTSEALGILPAGGAKKVQVICPGFSADCLETLEEIAMENKAVFLEAGGESYGYIPALNTDTAHIDMIAGLVARHAADWLSPGAVPTADELAQRKERAVAAGAER